MRKDWLIAIGLALVVVLSGAMGCDSATPAKQPGGETDVIPIPEETNKSMEGPANQTPGESNFNFVFRYGIMAKNILDTFQGTYSKDMVRDPNIVVYLSLSEDEMDRIYEKMVEVDFFNYPDRFSVSVPPGVPSGIRTPYSSYYFKVEQNSSIKELWWNDEIFYKDYTDEKADRLRELIKLIRDIVESKEEFRELPEPTSAYQ